MATSTPRSEVKDNLNGLAKDATKAAKRTATKAKKTGKKVAKQAGGEMESMAHDMKVAAMDQLHTLAGEANTLKDKALDTASSFLKTNPREATIGLVLLGFWLGRKLR